MRFNRKKETVSLRTSESNITDKDYEISIFKMNKNIKDKRKKTYLVKRSGIFGKNVN